MADFKPKVTSVRIGFDDGSQATYLMVQTESFPEAQRIAKAWAKEQRGKTASDVSLHQGIITAPDQKSEAVIDGLNVWELPF